LAKHTLNPDTLFDSQQYGFSQIVVVPPGKTVYLSGQVAWDEKQKIVGPGDLRAQMRQAIENLALGMAAAGGSLEDVVSLRIYVVAPYLDQGRHIAEALKEAFGVENAPAATWVGVQRLADPDFLIEIEAVGVID
jgi:enamine deaminase RidA (YjgF/YER057c/UK114 family)